MNTVKIEYALFRIGAQIEINGEPLDILNDSLKVLRKDFLLYAPSLFSVLDRYFSAPYVLEFTGTAYQGRCLEELSNSTAHCQNFLFREMRSAVPEAVLLEGFETLKNKYGVREEADFTLKVRTAAEEPSIDDGDICICSPDAIPTEFGEKILLCLSDKYAVYNANGKYVFEIPAEMKQLFLDHYRVSSKINPYLSSVLRKLPVQKFAREDQVYLKAIRTGVAQYILENVPPTLDVGNTGTFLFHVYPKTAEDDFCVSVSDPEVVSLTGCVLSALKAGECELMVTNSKGELLEKRKISVLMHEYVQSIRLVATFSCLLPNTTGKIDAYLLPEKAEDAHLLAWSSSDIDVAQVSSDGKVIAFKPGICKITASTPYAAASVTLQVKPPVREIRLRQTKTVLQQNESCRLDCEIVPPDGAVEKIEWSLDKTNLGNLHVSSDNLSCTFSALPEKSGNCSITCEVNDGAHANSCHLQLLPPPDHTGLYVVTIITTIIATLILSWLTMLLGFAGYLACFALPTILSLIGLQYESPKYHFKRLLILNLVCGILYLIIHFAACGA